MPFAAPTDDTPTPYQSPLDLRIEPMETGETGSRGRCLLPRHCEGYEGIAHGGAIAMLFDDAMALHLRQLGIRALTGQLEIRYKRPVPVDETVEIEANLEESRPPIYNLRGRLRVNGHLAASATARFMDPRGS